MIKVMIVDDSPSICFFLTEIISSDPELAVISSIHDGESAVAAVAAFDPDVITMDLQMPKMNGYEAIAKIMSSRPKPIIVITSLFKDEAAGTIFKAIEAGALIALNIPYGFGHPLHQESVQELLSTIKRAAKKSPKPSMQPSSAIAPTLVPNIEYASAQIRMVALGASTGGPVVLRTILHQLPANFPAPILIAQHMSPGFMAGFAEWLGDGCKLPIQLGEEDQVPLAGHVYSAPESCDIAIKASGKITLRVYKDDQYSRPSISHLFKSIADVHGKHSIGILLTGMGRDGVDGLRQMSENGAITIAQDEKSSVIFGMPSEAINAGAARYVLSPEAIAVLLVAISSGGTRATNI